MPSHERTVIPAHPCLLPLPPSSSVHNQSSSSATEIGSIPSTSSTMATGVTHRMMVANPASSPHHHVNAATGDLESLTQLLYFERQIHQLTLEALEERGKRLKALEEDLQQQITVSNDWALSYSQCSNLLQQKDSEIHHLKSRIKALENKERFRLDNAAPKDHQIKVLRRKVARLSRSLSASASPSNGEGPGARYEEQAQSSGVGTAMLGSPIQIPQQAL